ncbi:hypothetical protein J6590_075985 [Homalodisca vitripennis]|nr:hypothetical protein J6590_075985 [Homalodisca vitripennis]
MMVDKTGVGPDGEDVAADHECSLGGPQMMVDKTGVGPDGEDVAADHEVTDAVDDINLRIVFGVTV